MVLFWFLVIIINIAVNKPFTPPQNSNVGSVSNRGLFSSNPGECYIVLTDVATYYRLISFLPCAAP